MMFGIITDKSDQVVTSRRDIPGLALALLLFGTAILVKVIFREYFLPNNLANFKDLVATLGTIISTSLLILGSIFSYYRFFKGRTFEKKLNIKINVKVIGYSTTQHLHALDISLTNQGATAIWNPTTNLTVSRIGKTTFKLKPFLLKVPDFDPAQQDALIEPQESFHLHQTLRIKRSRKAVSYYIKVDSEKNHWGKVITIPNKRGYEYLEAK